MGGTIDKSGNVNTSPPGQVEDPRKVSHNASVALTTDYNTKSTFHSHPSGTVVIGQGSGNSSTSSSVTIGGGKTTYRFQQAPSSNDVNKTTAGSTNYVFARGSEKVYIYNNKGVVATLPHNRFVNFKK